MFHKKHLNTTWNNTAKNPTFLLLVFLVKFSSSYSNETRWNRSCTHAAKIKPNLLQHKKLFAAIMSFALCKLQHAAVVSNYPILFFPESLLNHITPIQNPPQEILQILFVPRRWAGRVKSGSARILGEENRGRNNFGSQRKNKAELGVCLLTERLKVSLTQKTLKRRELFWHISLMEHKLQNRGKRLRIIKLKFSSDKENLSKHRKLL